MKKHEKAQKCSKRHKLFILLADRMNTNKNICTLLLSNANTTYSFLLIRFAFTSAIQFCFLGGLEINLSKTSRSILPASIP